MKLILCLAAFLLVTQSLGAPDGKRDWMKTLGKQRKLSIDERIVGGVEATPHEFPWMAALLFDSWFCTGSILNNEWILTAGHCTTKSTTVIVSLGAHTIKGGIGVEGFNVKVTNGTAGEILVHENFVNNPFRIANDIGLIKLPAPITLGGNVQAVPALEADNSTALHVGDTVTIAGWGKDSDGDTAAGPVLRKATVEVISNAECDDVYGSIITDSITCTTAAIGVGTCNGDSGGPMGLKVVEGVPTQIGITSFGSSAGCESGKPDAFTRVASFRAWIKQKTGV